MSQQTCTIYHLVISSDYEWWMTRKLNKKERKLNAQVRVNVKVNWKCFKSDNFQRSWTPKFHMVHNVDNFKAMFVDQQWHDFSRVRMIKRRKQSGNLEPRMFQAHRNCVKVVVKTSGTSLCFKTAGKKTTKNARSKSWILEQMSSLKFIIKKK